MECTQRLECTQDFYETQCEKICPDQIGFLGICGTKYPVKRGPNKIGRDPQTCSIVLNLNSVSRQHAVINILNSREFMLMDLDSANKTKLLGKTLQPYIPHALKNGDTVQFGQVFGVFRLFEDETDLPMTQALDIPETPVISKHVSRINNAQVTTIPESPDVSDKDDSFIVASQNKSEKELKSSNNNFIKPSGKRIAIQPVGSKKIDNIYWTSSKKSTSISLRIDDSNNSFNDSTISLKNDSSNHKKVDIHELDTQEPLSKRENIDSIHAMETQAPFENNDASIHELSTQAPTLGDFLPVKENSIHNIDTQIQDIDVLAKERSQSVPSPSIYSLETQLPVPEKEDFESNEDAPNEINESQSINNFETLEPGLLTHPISNIKSIHSLQEPELCEETSSKDKEDSIFEAATQAVSMKEAELVFDQNTENNVSNESKGSNFNLFDEVDTQFFLDDGEPNSLNTKDPEIQSTDNENATAEDEDTQKIKPLKCKMRIDSDSSTDCDDIHIMPTQKIDNKVPDEDLTDCEDDIFGSEKICEPKNESKNATDVLDQPTQILQEKDEDFFPKNKSLNAIDILDQPTQVLQEKDEDDLQDVLTQVIAEDYEIKPEKESDFEDVLTQKIEDYGNEKALEDLPTQILVEKPERSIEIKNKENSFESPFKVPFSSPLRVKKSSKIITQKQDVKKNQEINQNLEEDDEKYYKATQDIFDDLCSQKNLSPEIEKDHLITIENRQLSPKKTCHISPGCGDTDEIEKNIVNKHVDNAIASETKVSIIQKVLSDPSDIDLTPKKLKPFKLLETELPDSQEIKIGVSFTSRSVVTESSSDSEVEQNDSEDCTPILFKKKKTVKSNVKMDLSKKFDLESLPCRVSTRTRKPTEKIKNGEGDAVTVSKSILKSKFLNEQEDNIDDEIIVENISRLRNKSKNMKKDKNVEKKEVGDKVKEIKQEEKVKQKIKDPVDTNAVIKTEQKRPRGRPRIIKKSTEDAIVTEIINKRNSNKSNEFCDSKNSIISDGNNKNIINSNSERGKRTSGRTKNSSKKQEIVNEKTQDQDVVIQKRKINSKEEKSNHKKDNKKEKVDIKNDDSIKPDRRKRSTKRETKIEICDLTSDEKESDVRRSKRRRYKEIIVKSNSQGQDTSATTQPPPKEQRKSKKFEQSTVYNISSGSGNDSPKNLKRSFTGEAEVPTAKRSRSNVSENSSVCATPTRPVKTHRVLFTAFPCEEVRNKLEKLGAVVVTDVTKCTVLLTLQIKRTFKLLCAVGLGVPIVGPNWVQACVDTNMIVDPWLYLIKDGAAEKRFSFSLERTLTGKRSFLSGYNVSSTASVLPAAAEMKLIVESSGGVWKNEGPKWICVSCTADKSQWPTLKRKGATIVSTELILGGVLRQKLDIERNKLQ